MLSKETDTDGDEQVHSSPKRYVKKWEAIEVWKYLNVREVSDGSPPTQILPSHVLYFLRINFGKTKPFEMAMNIPK